MSTTDTTLEFGDTESLQFWIQLLDYFDAQTRTVDLLCNKQITSVSAACFAIATASAKYVNTKQAVYTNIYIIIIKQQTATIDESSEDYIATFDQTLDDFISHVRESEQEEDIHLISSLKSRSRVLTIHDTYLSGLLAHLQSLTEESAILVIGCDKVGDRPANEERSQLEIDSGQNSEPWAACLRNLTQAVVPIAADKRLYVLLHSYEAPKLRATYESLSHIDQVNLCATGLNTEAALTDIVRKMRDDNEISMEHILEKIDSYNLAELPRTVLKSYIAHSRGASTYQNIQPYLDELKTSADPTIALLGARVALGADERSIAIELVDVAMRVSVLTTRQIVVGLNLAMELATVPTQQAILRRLRAETRELQEVVILAVGQRAIALGALEILCELIKEFPIAQATRCSELTRLAIDLIAALWIHRPESEATSMKGQEQENVEENKQENDASTASSLNNPEILHAELIGQILSKVIEFIAAHPGETELRNKLIRSLAVDVAGIRGPFYLVALISNAKKPSLEVSISLPETDGEALDEDDPNVSKLLGQLLNRLKEVSPSGGMALGLGNISLDGIPAPRQLLSFLTRIITFGASNRLASQDDIQLLLTMIHLAFILARQIKGEAFAFHLLSVAGGGLCSAGFFQEARNLAEHALLLASQSSSSRVRRAAWYQYADICQRGHNQLEALIGLACGTAQSDAILEPLTYYYEIRLWIRILRELRFRPLAIKWLKFSRDLLARYSIDWLNHEVEFLELSLQFQEIERDDDDALIKELANQLLALCSMTRERSTEILPVASLLAQAYIILIKKDPGMASSPLSNQIQIELEQCATLMGEPNASRLRLLGATKPTMESVQSLCVALDDTFYTEDLATDVAYVEFFSKRALSGALGAPTDSLYFLECLCDHSIRLLSEHFSSSEEQQQYLASNRDIQRILRGDQSNQQTIPELELAFNRHRERLERFKLARSNRAPRLPKTHEELVAALNEFAQHNIETHVLGIDDDHTLVRVSYAHGLLSVARESSDVFNIDAFHRWQEEFPYNYQGFDLFCPNGYSETEKTLNKIGLSVPPSQHPILIIADRKLQSLPANMLLIQGRPAGYDRPVASAPSVNWLRAARHTPLKTNGIRRAWIPVEEDSPALSALRILRDSTLDILAKYSIDYEDTSIPPPDLGDSELLILGSHGQLDQDGAYFQTVASEGSWRFNARDLAGRVAGCSVVVLFVCSGGRWDAHPHIAATLGLPRLLLDHGCRSVIASPWPLDIRIPIHWLPAFLAALDEGAPVMMANYAGNQAVRSWKDHPAAFSALHVFGDPFVQFHRK